MSVGKIAGKAVDLLKNPYYNGGNSYIYCGLWALKLQRLRCLDFKNLIRFFVANRKNFPFVLTEVRIMPKLKNQLPKLCENGGYAFSSLKVKISLGKGETPEARQVYARYTKTIHCP